MFKTDGLILTGVFTMALNSNTLLSMYHKKCTYSVKSVNLNVKIYFLVITDTFCVIFVLKHPSSFY